MDQLDTFLKLINTSYSQFHVIDNIKQLLLDNGFIEVFDNNLNYLEKGKNYFLTRNDSSIIAFKIPKEINNISFLLSASHSDSPTFKLKPNPLINKDNYLQLNVEPYGGGIYSTWLDKPLSIAGRVIVKNNNKIETKLLNINKDLLIIPNLCIHFNRNINQGYAYNPSKDLIPILGLNDVFYFNFKKFLLDTLHLDFKTHEVLSFDLYLYLREEAKIIGLNSDFIGSPKLDNLASVYSMLIGFLNSKNDNQITVYSVFDNEEVGSLTRQGANSTFLKDTLKRIVNLLNGNEIDYINAIQKSFLISVDNAHATHPNYLEYQDRTSPVVLNKGIAIKYNANQSYTSDGFSSSILKYVFEKAHLEYQEFTNRSDLRGGSTLGNISNSEVSILSADIGIPQLAMHSSFELCGQKDLFDLMKFSQVFYSTFINIHENKVIFK